MVVDRAIAVMAATPPPARARVRPPSRPSASPFRPLVSASYFVVIGTYDIYIYIYICG